MLGDPVAVLRKGIFVLSRPQRRFRLLQLIVGHCSHKTGDRLYGERCDNWDGDESEDDEEGAAGGLR